MAAYASAMPGSIASALSAQPRASLKCCRSNSSLTMIVITSAARGSARSTGVQAATTLLYFPRPSSYAFRQAGRSSSAGPGAVVAAGAVAVGAGAGVGTAAGGGTAAGLAADAADGAPLGGATAGAPGVAGAGIAPAAG